MITAALTGNFGMGKSYVLSVFRDLGAETLDTDRVVGILLADREVVDRIKDLLGPEVVDAAGALSKKAVAAKIFSDSGLREKVEALIHPLVFEKTDEFISRIEDRGSVVVVEVPLLFEGRYEERYWRVITVYASEETALERLTASGISREEALARMRSQLSIDTKKARADYTVDNNGTREETRAQVEAIYRSLCEEAIDA